MEDKIRTLAVDFDGTLVENKYPQIGEPLRFGFNTLIKMQRNGWKIILLTMREGQLLEEAIKFSAKQGLIFDAVNENPFWKSKQVIKETKDGQQIITETSSKIYADIYIDDHGLGIPKDSQGVNWFKCKILLEEYK